MSTKITEADWAVALEVFRASLPQRGAKGRNDRLSLEALHYFLVHNITWRALPERFGNWNRVWKRFDRLSKAGVFEAFFDHLAALSSSAHLVQMFDSTECARMCQPRARLDPDLASTLVTAPDNLSKVVKMDPDWIAANRAAVMERWTTWISG
ncbi:transposase [Mesorhizobium sangaii]|uniref:Transposase n=1 Tax=Mesorhizobium sangaii TaxID=505389 RepID=A0A841PG43_9HYPH|nr:transposase [Mesorhizobium sangaii]MBB6414157.1 transposase [Mesorhizobium sangaii]